MDKVTKVARPMSAPKPQELGLSRAQHAIHEGPIWREELSEMSELPTHLVSTALRDSA